MDIPIADPAAIKPMETNISRRCAFRIRVRGGFNGVWVSPPHPIGAPPKVLPRPGFGKYRSSTRCYVRSIRAVSGATKDLCAWKNTGTEINSRCDFLDCARSWGKSGRCATTGSRLETRERFLDCAKKKRRLAPLGMTVGGGVDCVGVPMSSHQGVTVMRVTG
jgi:hypothetical protein